MQNERSQEAPDAQAAGAVLGRPALSPAPREVLSLKVQRGRRAPAYVRSALRQIRELGSARDDVILVASELVTNVIVYSGGSPSDLLGVRAVLSQGLVSVLVHDPGSSDHTPRWRPDADRSWANGWALGIVRQLAQRWGFEVDPTGLRVWAELRLPVLRLVS